MKPMSARPRLAAIAVSLFFLAGAGLPAHAATQSHDHGHGHGAAVALKPGQKWQTDAPLREGMEKIRASLEPRLEAIHVDKLPADQYKLIARESAEQMGYIVKNCKLKPDADAVLHEILAELGHGVDALQGTDPKLKPADGARKVVAALDRYGKTFDHPGWKSLGH